VPRLPAPFLDGTGYEDRVVGDQALIPAVATFRMHASPGVGGGYRLGAGAALPPLLLDDEEAVAVAVGLRTAAGASVTGIQETSIRALAKLEQVLPSRLRHRVNPLQTATVEIPAPGPTVPTGSSPASRPARGLSPASYPAATS
jgi:predicted DNA-binding transcriptional regulator YafY